MLTWTTIPSGSSDVSYQQPSAPPFREELHRLYPAPRLFFSLRCFFLSFSSSTQQPVEQQGTAAKCSAMRVPPEAGCLGFWAAEFNSDGLFCATWCILCRCPMAGHCPCCPLRCSAASSRTSPTSGVWMTGGWPSSSCASKTGAGNRGLVMSGGSHPLSGNRAHTLC